MPGELGDGAPGTADRGCGTALPCVWDRAGSASGIIKKTFFVKLTKMQINSKIRTYYAIMHI